MAVIAAGAFVAVYYVNGVVKGLYQKAVYRSDPRLVQLRHRGDTRSTRLWSWAAKAMEICWIPLWLDHEQLREDSFDKALEDSLSRVRTRKLYLESLPTLAEEKDVNLALSDQTTQPSKEEDNQKRLIFIFIIFLRLFLASYNFY